MNTIIVNIATFLADFKTGYDGGCMNFYEFMEWAVTYSKMYNYISDIMPLMIAVIVIGIALMVGCVIYDRKDRI